MKRAKEKQVGVPQSLLLAGLVMASVGAQASVTITTGSGIADRIVNAGSISVRNPGITIQNPGLIIQLPPASSSANGSMNYSVGTSSGNFSESDSSPDGSLVELELNRKGYGYRAEAFAETGLAKARVETKWVAGSGNGSSAAGASSMWSDWFVISGGTGTGTASFASMLDGVLSSGKNGSASFSLNIGYTPSTNCYILCSEADNSQALVNQSFSLSGKGKSTLEQELEGEFTFAYDKPFALTVMLGVNAVNGGMADFTLTSLSDSLALPVGSQLLSSSGLYVQAVPEAETYAMMLAGLGLVGWATKRRRTLHA
ncbi:MAG: PEP-CTERM sorting domain-containing protein [Thiobacillus sp.]|nr:PEP-CTERM sorting domain-containing protein [Thiobacillus sp.]